MNADAFSEFSSDCCCYCWDVCSCAVEDCIYIHLVQTLQLIETLCWRQRSSADRCQSLWVWRAVELVFSGWISSWRRGRKTRTEKQTHYKTAFPTSDLCFLLPFSEDYPLCHGQEWQVQFMSKPGNKSSCLYCCFQLFFWIHFQRSCQCHLSVNRTEEQEFE